MDRFQVYIAGFDVFRPDCLAFFAEIRRACNALGLRALVPLDNDIDIQPSQDQTSGMHSDPDDTPASRARRIRAANIAMLQKADAVIANLAPFRGLEPDAGTVFEVGYAQGIGLPVVGYGAGRASYAARVGAVTECVRDAQGRLQEKASGMAVEDFGLPVNLMLATGMPLEPDVHTALRAVAAALRLRAQQPPASLAIAAWQPERASRDSQAIHVR